MKHNVLITERNPQLSLLDQQRLLVERYRLVERFQRRLQRRASSAGRYHQAWSE